MRTTLFRMALVLASAAAVLAAPVARAGNGQIEIEGLVQSMPAGGSFVGDWVIDGKNVRSTAETVIEQDDGPLVVGARVEVKGTAGTGGLVVALKIEVESDDDEDEGEIKGPIDALPADGSLLGTWIVGGQNVIVLSTTRLLPKKGNFVVGALVEVDGTPSPEGLVASRVKAESSGGPGGHDDEGTLEIDGTIEALPAGAPADLIGTWKVAGRDIVVTVETKLEAEDGPFAVGVTVEVKGFLLDGGAVQATKIESKSGNGAGEPALVFWGSIQALPPGGLIGVWTVDGKSVNVTPATELETDDGPFVLGITVKVKGWLQADGPIEAHSIETEDTTPASASGKVAVEYRHTGTGFYFMTALQSEIQALDGGAFGGVWVRTGETIKIGGNVGVCRFYGMPPKGPSSHFFTADPVECKKVMSEFDAWTFEQHAFAIFAAPNGTCPPGLVPVRRFYNNPAAGTDVNHRYVVRAAIAEEMTALGWVDEGIVMCAQK